MSQLSYEKFQNNLNIEGDLTVKGKLIAKDNITIDGDLLINGNIIGVSSNTLFSELSNTLRVNSTDNEKDTSISVSVQPGLYTIDGLLSVKVSPDTSDGYGVSFSLKNTGSLNHIFYTLHGNTTGLGNYRTYIITTINTYSSTFSNLVPTYQVPDPTNPITIKGSIKFTTPGTLTLYAIKDTKAYVDIQAHSYLQLTKVC